MGELDLGLGRRLRYGMIGGGPDAFIGAVHRRAAALDGDIELVAGAFSADRERSDRQGAQLLLDQSRVYASYQEMAQVERGADPDHRLDFITIVTPNNIHWDVARAFLECDFPVVCDKPLTTTVEDALAMLDLVQRRNLPFAVTYNYSGYPMVRQARDIVRSGELGDVRKIVVEYSQGWLANAIEMEGQKQASWRSDPAVGGQSLALGDIGTHGEHLMRYVTGLEVESVSADLTTHVPNRALEDDATVLFRCAGGAKGVMLVSQISVGEENNLVLRVYGTRASIEWHQEQPNYLILRRDAQPALQYARGNPYIGSMGSTATRLPPGHPEGFIEAFANIYADFAATLARRILKTESDEESPYPTVMDGVRGVQFVRACIESGTRREWVDLVEFESTNGLINVAQ